MNLPNLHFSKLLNEFEFVCRAKLTVKKTKPNQNNKIAELEGDLSSPTSCSSRETLNACKK